MAIPVSASMVIRTQQAVILKSIKQKNKLKYDVAVNKIKLVVMKSMVKDVVTKEQLRQLLIDLTTAYHTTLQDYLTDRKQVKLSELKQLLPVTLDQITWQSV